MSRPTSPSLVLENEPSPKRQAVHQITHYHYTTHNHINNHGPVTINSAPITNNAPNTSNNRSITSFFNRQTGPAPPPEANPNAFLTDIKYSGDLKRTRDGTLMKKCTNHGGKCSKGLQRIDKFAPTPCNKNDGGKVPEFNSAIEKYGAALEKKDVPAMNEAMLAVEEASTKVCRHCRDIMHKTKFEGENNQEAILRRKIAEMRKGKFAICASCGTDRAIQFDHKEGTKPKGMRSGCDPIELLAEFGTPEAAIKHLEESCGPLCACCHAAEPTSSSANRYTSIDQADPSRTTKEYRQMKMEYNDEMKRQVGKCQNPNCKKDGPTKGIVEEGYEMCFDWNHLNQQAKARDENGKPISICDMCNDCKRDPDWKEKLDHERRGCELLCRNCHHEYTHRERW